MYQAVGLSRLHRDAEALATWDKAVALDKALPPTPLRAQLRLGRMGALARTADYAQAVAEAEAEVKRVFFLPASTYFNAACVYAAASATAAADPALADRYAARAVQLLRQAIASGYRDGVELQKDHDLESLRRRADYAELLWNLADLPAPVK